MAKAPLIPRRRPRTPSRTERAVGVGALTVLVVLFTLFFLAGTRPGPLAGADEGAPTHETAMFPDRSPAGWPRGTPERYTEQTLFEKINGKADAYLAYRFEALHFAGYEDAATGAYVDVYVYEMQSALDAFGVYRAGRTGAETAFAVGAEGVERDASVFFRSGPYLVEVIGSGPEAREETQAIARAVAEALPGPTPLVRVPDELVGPEVRLIQFARRGALGVEGLDDAFVALHEDGTRVVLAESETAEAASALAARVREDLEFLGQTFTLEQNGKTLRIVVGKGAER